MILAVWLKNEHSLEYHMKIHTGERKFKCSECENSFIQQHHLKEHTRRHHSSAKYLLEHKCIPCDKSYKDKGAFQYHMEAMHSNNQLKCPNCDKIFGTRQNLREHERRQHSWVRILHCKI